VMEKLPRLSKFWRRSSDVASRGSHSGGCRPGGALGLFPREESFVSYCEGCGYDLF